MTRMHLFIFYRELIVALKGLVLYLYSVKYFPPQPEPVNDGTHVLYSIQAIYIYIHHLVAGDHNRFAIGILLE